MNECVIACETLRDELLFAMEAARLRTQIVWIESGLHDTPNKLRVRLQQALDAVAGRERVFLLFGVCGNAALGLRTGAFTCIMPRVDDCISLLIGSPQARAQIGREHAAYFMTEGWLRGERNLWVEYQYCVNKYGEEQARSIAHMMYGHYRTLGILDMGVAPLAPLLASTKTIADTLGLRQKVFPATTDYIRDLLTGPWPPERFLVKEPFSEITAQDLLMRM